MTREEKLKVIAKDVEGMASWASGEELTIEFAEYRGKEGTVLTDWDIQRLNLTKGEEYFFIHVGNALLYAVNVTADAILTAVAELTSLLAKKF